MAFDFGVDTFNKVVVSSFVVVVLVVVMVVFALAAVVVFNSKTDNNLQFIRTRQNTTNIIIY